MVCPECEQVMHMDSTGLCSCIQCGYKESQNPDIKVQDFRVINSELNNFTFKDESFTKADTGKPMVSLVVPEFILGVAEVLTFGAKKYSIDNWKTATQDDIRRIRDSLLRHTLAYTGGEMLDPESGLSHAYHIGCNVMFLNYLLELNGDLK